MHALVTVVLLASCASPDATPLPTTGPPAPGILSEPPLSEIASARIAFVGDVMMHGMVLRAAEDAEGEEGASDNHDGFDALYADVAGMIRAADLAFANLETPVAPKARLGVREMVFNAPPVLLESLVATGFDVVSFANNHVYDQGRPGFVESLDILDTSGLAYVGAGRTCEEARTARRFDLSGISVAFLGSTELFNDYLNAGEDEPCSAMLDEEWAIEQARAAREAGADIVLLSIHWGVEYDTAPQPRQIALAHRLIEGGVDAIIGHHPHVLQPIEVVETADGRQGLVVYSLGNFVSNQSAWYVPGLHAADQGNPRDGLLLSMRLVKRRYGRGARRVVRTELADVIATPLWTVNNTYSRRSEPVEIRVVPTMDRMAALDDALAEVEDEPEIVKLSRERTEMDVRWRTVGAIVGPQFLPVLPGSAPSDR